MTSLLVLTHEDVKDLLGISEAIEAVEQVFVEFADGRAVMPAKSYLDFPKHQGDIRVMPASMGDSFAGVKIVNSHSRNPEKGLPSVMGTFLLLKQETGEPLALMDATYLTAVRTGAASAVATRRMARPESSTVGLVGAGVQAGYQLEALSMVSPISAAKVWAPDFERGRRDTFIQEIVRRFPEISVVAADSVEEAVAADVVCTTTPSREPLVIDGWVAPGTHLNAVGADGPGKQELDPALLRRARVIVDEQTQAEHGGEINVPLSTGELNIDDLAGDLAAVVSGKVPGRVSQEEVTIFDSTGLAIEDIAVAALVYEKALQKGSGSVLDL